LLSNFNIEFYAAAMLLYLNNKGLAIERDLSGFGTEFSLMIPTSVSIPDANKYRRAVGLTFVLFQSYLKTSPLTDNFNQPFQSVLF
jgi:hypothetical protein